MKNNIKKIFEKFEQDIHELSFYGDIVKKSYDKYLSEIEQNKKNHPSVDFYSAKKPVYFDIQNNKKIISNLSITKRLDQIEDDILFHLNKQMQWFLVEAYELYEDFIQELYSTMGYLDNDFWDALDFGKVQLNFINNKDETWFSEQIKHKKGKPYSIIEVFTKRFDLTKYSDIKTPTINYQFLMKLVADFRHAIVHNRGFLDKKIYTAKVFKAVGIKGDDLIKKYEQYMDVYYGSNRYKNLICLTTINDTSTVPGLPLSHDRRLILTQHILSYAYLLTQLSIEYLEAIDNDEQK